MKICRETQNLLQIEQNFGHFTWRPTFVSYGWQRCMQQNINGTHCCVSITTLSVLMILLTATYVWQQYKETHCFRGLWERTKMLRYRLSTLAALFTLTLRLLMSYIYGAPSKARNANVVYIWTYVWQRWNSLFLFAAQCFNTKSMQRGFLCHICV